MLQIDDTIVSLALIEKEFSCDLTACKGNCCRYGDTGAPLMPEEAATLERIGPELRPYLRPEGIRAIDKLGTSIKDLEGEDVTPLINNEECAYTVMEGDIFRCGIEMAFIAGAVDFRKPLSCHLFPVRVKQYRDFRAVNYEEWSICRPGVVAGTGKGIKLYAFLKEPLVRSFGEEWYDKLQWSANEYAKKNNHGSN
ncbi:MAG: DUF3109 family protein [Bacteroidales bacterium]|nr:DUF3109 family protein [Bacteroidales bacterium]MDT8374883.1 DUF3109 family protein [Bacteroidales bacterium]